MGKFSGCLLASDYDGTLADDGGRILPEVCDKIKYFIAEGGFFTVCTGRTQQGFHAYAREIINAPVLLANGIMAFDYAAGKTVFCHGIESRDAGLVTLLQQAFPDICIELYNSGFRTFAIRLNERSRLHFTRQDISWTDILGVEEAEPPFVKIMLSTGAERGREVQRWLNTALADYDLKYIPSTGEFVEIINKHADKGRGLTELALLLGVRPEMVFAAGDGENDADMLRAAAYSFAPQNGSIAAKNAATHIVCDNNTGAVAHAITLIEKLIG